MRMRVRHTRQKSDLYLLEIVVLYLVFAVLDHWRCDWDELLRRNWMPFLRRYL